MLVVIAWGKQKQTSMLESELNSWEKNKSAVDFFQISKTVGENNLVLHFVLSND